MAFLPIESVGAWNHLLAYLTEDDKKRFSCCSHGMRTHLVQMSAPSEKVGARFIYPYKHRNTATSKMAAFERSDTITFPQARPDIHFSYPKLDIDVQEALYVRYMNPQWGIGTFASQYIPKGSTVAVYTGEYAPTKEVRRRHRHRERHDPAGCNYILTVREIVPRTQTVSAPAPAASSVTETNTTAVEKDTSSRSGEYKEGSTTGIEDSTTGINADGATESVTAVTAAAAASDNDNGEPPAKRVAIECVLVTNIDATAKGGIARFINHSCDPNCEMLMFRKASPNSTAESLLATPYLRTLRPIFPDEQLTFDYGYSDYLAPNGSKKAAKKATAAVTKTVAAPATTASTSSSGDASVATGDPPHNNAAAAGASGAAASVPAEGVDGEGTTTTEQQQQQQQQKKSDKELAKEKEREDDIYRRRRKCACGSKRCREFIPFAEHD